MASPVTSTATTLEGQILEVVQAANTLEQALAEEDNQDRFSVTFDLDATPPQVTISATFDVTVTTSAGKISVQPVAYLP